MGHEAIKLELIEGLTKLEDDDTLDYLKVVKESCTVNEDWWNDLTAEEKSGIERGLQDIENGRVISHRDIKIRYGLISPSTQSIPPSPPPFSPTSV